MPYPGTVELMANLDWDGAEEYRLPTINLIMFSNLKKCSLFNRQTGRDIWRVGNDVAGYSKEVRNLKVVMVRDSGHMVPMDQPLWALDMIDQFVREKPLPITQN